MDQEGNSHRNHSSSLELGILIPNVVPRMVLRIVRRESSI